MKQTDPYEPKRLARTSASPTSYGGAGGLWRARLGDLLFYLALAVLVLGVFLFRGVGSGPPIRVLGFSAMRVLTASMGDELPQDCLIVTRWVDPAELEIGDDITYLVNEDTTVTHRIVGITEDYENSGERAFTTQGVMNAAPDGMAVPAVNVVGKVIWHSLFLGRALGFVRERWVWIAVLLALSLGLLASLRVVVQESRNDRARAEEGETGEERHE